MNSANKSGARHATSPPTRNVRRELDECDSPPPEEDLPPFYPYGTRTDILEAALESPPRTPSPVPHSSARAPTPMPPSPPRTPTPTPPSTPRSPSPTQDYWNALYDSLVREAMDSDFTTVRSPLQPRTSRATLALPPRTRPALPPRTPHAKPPFPSRTPHARPPFLPRTPHARPPFQPRTPQARPPFLPRTQSSRPPQRTPFERPRVPWVHSPRPRHAVPQERARTRLSKEAINMIKRNLE